MDKSLKGLKPEALWKHFDQIRQCPRCSGHEGPVREYVVSFAKEKKLDYAVDEVGNVMIYKKASPGKEKAPGVILQGHLDMVCEKDSHVVHDFSKDPIKLKLDGEWLMADGTYCRVRPLPGESPREAQREMISIRGTWNDS
ncbi:MAG: Cytosol non-specific dipeptidase [Candidatus Aminicenantes bacterium ADurb.Bin508]|nr:MAG: Cytosol non-specific dipeptidase [Candidatus Aminicenantes bacterium ADurb.Bin508]